MPQICFKKQLSIKGWASNRLKDKVETKTSNKWSLKWDGATGSLCAWVNTLFRRACLLASTFVSSGKAWLGFNFERGLFFNGLVFVFHHLRFILSLDLPAELINILVGLAESALTEVADLKDVGRIDRVLLLTNLAVLGRGHRKDRPWRVCLVSG